MPCVSALFGGRFRTFRVRFGRCWSYRWSVSTIYAVRIDHPYQRCLPTLPANAAATTPPTGHETPPFDSQAMTDRPGRRRYSLALVVRGRPATEIDGLRRALGTRTIERIPPHITLVPPVNVRLEDDAHVGALMRESAAASGPIELDLGPVATFWPHNPVLYLAVTGEAEDLQRMERLRLDLLQEPLVGPRTRTERPFVPHVTLEVGMSDRRLHAGLEALQDYRQTYVFERLTLLELCDGRRWDPVADVHLGRPSVTGTGGLPVTTTISGTPDRESRQWFENEWRTYGQARYGPDWRPDEPVTLVARREGQIAGVAKLELLGDVAELSRLIVAQAVRSQGIGAQLLKRAEQSASAAGCRRVRLRTIAGGRAADFYTSHGYQVTATLPEWRGGLDFVVMEKLLA